MANAAVRSSLNDLDLMLSDLDGAAVGNTSPPARPPQPNSYVPKASNKRAHPSYVMSLPRALHPPKLQHILDENKRHNLVKFEKRDESVLRAPDFPGDDYSDYSGGGANGSQQQQQQHLRPPESAVPELSDEELEAVDGAGEAPRGDKSMVIDTEHGKLKSKYTYMGFGLWEDTDPDQPPPPPRRASPPSPPPKAEVIWYNCTVVSESHKTSKELDDLFHDLDGFDRMKRRRVEVGNAARGTPSALGELHEPFDKENMSEMFRRAMLEKLALSDGGQQARHRCHACKKWIAGRTVTAMSRKYHPQCLVCDYCRKEFKDHKFKSDDDGVPYCHPCFEKLLGHFGTAHFDSLKDLP